MSQPLNLFQSDLSGITWVEASAGTGKTYSIAGVYLRMLLENPSTSLDKILVLTFTEAATRELRARIRVMLQGAVAAFAGAAASDPVYQPLQQVLGVDRCRRSLPRLRAEIQRFDQAPIYTIHGFCNRILIDYAFESGVLFDAVLETDETPILQQLADEFWRMRVLPLHPGFLVYLAAFEIEPDSILRAVRDCLRKHGFTIEPSPTMPDFEYEFRAPSTAYGELRATWRERHDEIETLLADAATDTRLHAGRYSPQQIDHRLSVLARWFAADVYTPYPDELAYFAMTKIAKATKKNQSPPTHPFFARVEAALPLFDQWNTTAQTGLIALHIAFIRYVEAELPRWSERRNVKSFRDLLTDVERLLREPERGGGLRSILRDRFPVVMVDEFQDTDPLQFSIVRKLFCESTSAVLLIGDPKQAIYGFRGADVFSYLDAKSLARNRYHLDTNWRSETNLVAAVNRLFSRIDRPFVMEQIEYEPVRASGQADRQPFTERGARSAPLRLWRMAGTAEDGVAESKELLRQRAYRLTLREIQWLLSPESGARIGDRPVAPADLAILVRRNEEALRFHALLEEHGIAAAVQSAQSVFHSREAADVHLLLSAIAQHGGDVRVRAALLTDVVGMTAGDLAQLDADGDAWDRMVGEFRGYYDLWDRHGLFTMLKRVLSRYRVKRRLLGLPDGERRLTNLLHIFELLHQAAIERHLGMDGVLHWLAQRQREDRVVRDEYELRLEKDHDAVRILTVHKSKGLEFPIVFCPFSWDASISLKQRARFVFHKEVDGMHRLVFDFGSADAAENRKIAERERLAEELRLLYVAATRAVNRCYLLHAHDASSANPVEKGPPLHFGSRHARPPASHPRGNFSDVEGERVASRALRLTSSAPRSALAYLLQPLAVDGQAADGESLWAGATDEIAVEWVDPNGSGPAPRQPRAPGEAITGASRTFKGHIETDWKVASFSFMTHAETANRELPDRDSLVRAGVGATESRDRDDSIFSFPAGAAAGSFFHEIFEEHEYTEADRSVLRALIESKLEQFGFAHLGRFVPAVMETIGDVLGRTLNADHGGFSLDTVRRDRRLHELEFCFPLCRTSSDLVVRLFREVGIVDADREISAAMERLQFSPIKGVLKGFIDLVVEHENRYYIIDWKSNWLGPTVADYAPARLRRAMAENVYFLQYHLYALALHLYLRQRLRDYDYDRRFGGVYYLFIRGMRREEGLEHGVFYDRPEKRCIEALEQRLVGSAS